MDPDIGDLIPPAIRLGLEVGKVPKGPSLKKVMANVSDDPLDLPLFIASPHIAGDWFEEIRPGKGHELGVESDFPPDPVGHDALQVVVEDPFRDALQEVKGLPMTSEKILQPLGKGPDERRHSGV